MISVTKQKETHRFRQQTYGCQWEGRGESMVREFGMNMYILLYLQWICDSMGYIVHGILQVLPVGDHGVA